MRHMRRALLFVVFVALVIAGMLLWLHPAHAPGTSSTASSTPALSSAVYPLYDNTSWGQPARESITIGTTTLAGVNVKSATIDAGMNPSAIFTPFENYYAQKLSGAGWSVDNQLAAGGHTGGQTGYRKDAELILTRFSIDYQNKPANAPSECPCTVTLSLFSATTTSP